MFRLSLTGGWRFVDLTDRWGCSWDLSLTVGRAWGALTDRWVWQASGLCWQTGGPNRLSWDRPWFSRANTRYHTPADPKVVGGLWTWLNLRRDLIFAIIEIHLTGFSLVNRTFFSFHTKSPNIILFKSI